MGNGIFVFIFKGNPLLDEVEGRNLQSVKGKPKPKEKIRIPGNFVPEGPKWEMESSFAFFKLIHF